MVWASDCLDGARDDEKSRLEGLKQSTNSCGVPFVTVESRKLLAELVGVCACPHADDITTHHCLHMLTSTWLLILPSFKYAVRNLSCAQR